MTLKWKISPMRRGREHLPDNSEQEQHSLPLTSPQRGFLDPAWIPLFGGGCCNISVAITLERSVAWATIQRAIDILALRHPALTTRFESANGQLLQRPASNLPIFLRRVDLLDRGADGERLAHAVTDEDTRAPFDLSSAPLCRFIAVQFSAGVRVVGTFHHAIFDARSAVVVRKELAQLIEQLAHRCEVQLDNIPRYGSVVADILERERRHDEYWREVSANLPTTYALPVKHRRPTNTVRYATSPFSVDEQRWQRLRHTCATARVSPMMAGVAAAVCVISQFGAPPYVGVSFMVHGRLSEAHMKVVGCFSSAVYAVVRVADDPTIHELLSRVRTEVLESSLKQPCAYEHSPLASDIPGVNWMPPRPDRKDPPSPASSTPSDATGSREVPAITFPSQSAGATLVFHVREHSLGLKGHVTYDDQRLFMTHAESIARRFERFLMALPDRLTSRLSDVLQEV